MSDSTVHPCKVFEPTPFKAAALNSFYNIAEIAKEKSKQYYSHLGIELKSPTKESQPSGHVVLDKGVGCELASLDPDRMNLSFCFNSSTISELRTIESILSGQSGDISFSRNII